MSHTLLALILNYGFLKDDEINFPLKIMTRLHILIIYHRNYDRLRVSRILRKSEFRTRANNVI